MIALEHKAETMQRDHEPSIRCFQNRGFAYHLQNNGDIMERFPELKDAKTAHPGDAIVEPKNSVSNESFVPPTEVYHRPVYQQEFCMWPSYLRAQPNQWNAFENRFYSMNCEYPYPVDNRFPYMPLKMYSHGYAHELQFQEFQYFVVIDFEATCDKVKNPHPQEIIEFPSVLVNSVTGELEASFQTYVRPMLHQHLSDFCKELTGIQQIQVDRGVPLSEALLMHDKWLEDKGIKQTNFAVVTWSNWDCRVMLDSECRLKRIRKPPYFNRWINLKVPFHEVFGGVRCNLKEAVQLAGLVWEGRAHCGLDDARNTARLLALLMRQGFKFSITNSLWQNAERPPTWQQFQERPSGSTHYPFRLKQPVMPLVQFHPTYVDPAKEQNMFCFCGVKSSKRMIRKPGPKQGNYFFGCGNWTATRGALCPYFEWASP